MEENRAKRDRVVWVCMTWHLESKARDYPPSDYPLGWFRGRGRAVLRYFQINPVLREA